MAEYEYGGKDTLTYRYLHGYKKLIVWQKGSDLGRLINKAVSKFGPGYYRLAGQMRDAATSVTANIAEGYCRSALGDYIRFCEIARGSLGELGSFIQDCELWGLLAGKELQQIVSFYRDTSYLLDRLIQSLKKKREEGTWDRQFWIKEGTEPYELTDSDNLDPADFP